MKELMTRYLERLSELYPTIDVYKRQIIWILLFRMSLLICQKIPFKRCHLILSEQR